MLQRDHNLDCTTLQPKGIYPKYSDINSLSVIFAKRFIYEDDKLCVYTLIHQL